MHCKLFERVKKGLAVNEQHKEWVYTFDVRFFNEKVVATRLRDCTITFLKKGKRQFDGIRIFPKNSISQFRTDTLTFESREFRAETLEVKISEVVEAWNKKRQASVSTEDGGKVTLVKAKDVKKVIEEANQVIFEGSWPTGKPFRQAIQRKEAEE